MRTLGQAANLCIRCASNKKTTCGDGIDAPTSRMWLTEIN